MEKENVRIGRKIVISATVEKESNFDIGDGKNRERRRASCYKEGFITGMRKKLIAWEIKQVESIYNPDEYCWQNVASKVGYVVEFRERLAGKTQEALLEDVELCESNDVMDVPW